METDLIVGDQNDTSEAQNRPVDIGELYLRRNSLGVFVPKNVQELEDISCSRYVSVERMGEDCGYGEGMEESNILADWSAMTHLPVN